MQNRTGPLRTLRFPAGSDKPEGLSDYCEQAMARRDAS